MVLKKQLHSGYILSTVKDSLSKFKEPVEFSSLLSQLSCFEIEYNFEDDSIHDSVVTVLDNLVLLKKNLIEKQVKFYIMIQMF